MKIESVSLEFPNCDDGTTIFYKVGELAYPQKKIVAEIKKAERQGEYCMIPYYEIYFDDGQLVELYHYSIVTYFPEVKP